MQVTKATDGQSAMVSIREMQTLIGRDVISLNALYRAAKNGDVPSIRIGSRVLVPRTWLIRQLKAK